MGLVCMKKIRLRFAIVAICLYIMGCTPHKVVFDLGEYINQDILGIGQLEQKALERYAAVTGANYTTDNAVYLSLRDEVIPLYKRFLTLLRQINPATDEVKRLNSIYISGAETVYEGLNAKMRALQKNDEGLVRAANAKIEEGSTLIQRWQQQLVALYEIHGMKPSK
jgi:hypothetical protein